MVSSVTAEKAGIRIRSATCSRSILWLRSIQYWEAPKETAIRYIMVFSISRSGGTEPHFLACFRKDVSGQTQFPQKARHKSRS